MDIHLKKDEWLEVFNLYEQYINYDIKKRIYVYKYIKMAKIFFIEIQSSV